MANKEIVINANKSVLEKELLNTDLPELLPNPDTVLDKSDGDTYQIYDDILADSFISGLVSNRNGGTLKYEWDINKAQDGETSDEEIEFLKTVFTDLISDGLREAILLSMYRGFSLLEVQWDTNARWFPKKVYNRNQEYLFYNGNGTAKIVKDVGDFEGEDLPPFKYIIPRYKWTDDQPYGHALASKSYWHNYFRKYMMKFMFLFSEKFGTPKLDTTVSMAMVEAMIGTDKINDATKLQEVVDLVTDQVNKISSDGNITHLEGIEVSTLEPKNAGQQNTYLDMIDLCNKRDSVAYLGHERAAMSSPGELGSNEESLQAEEHIIIEGNTIVEKYINQLIVWVHEFNFEGAPPVFKLFKRDTLKKELAERDAILSKDQGVKFNEDYYQDIYEIDKKYFSVVDVDNSDLPDSKNPQPTEKTEKEKIKVLDDDDENNFKFNQFFNILNKSTEDVTFEDQKIADDFYNYLMSNPSKLNDFINDYYYNTMFNFAKGSKDLEEMNKNVYGLFDKFKTGNMVEFIEKIELIMNIHGVNSMRVDNGKES